MISEKLIKDFLHFEKKENPEKILFNKKNIWFHIRYAIFYYLIDLKQYSYDFKKKRKFNFNLINRAFDSFYSLRKIFTDSDIIIYDYGRPQKIGSKVINPLVLSLSKAIPKKYKVTVITKDFEGIVNLTNKNYEVINIFLLHKTILFFLKLSSFAYIKGYSQEIERKLNSYFNKKILMKSIINTVYLNQWSLGLCFNIIFYFKKPKIIFYSDNSEMTEVIYFAKDKNIKTVDIQHSLISSLNILYQHNLHSKNTYLSDYIFIYGNFWKNFISEQYQTISVGNYLNDYNLLKYKKYIVKEKYITIISSIFSRKKLIDLALKLSKAFPKKKIVYKLRPDEYSSWTSIYPKKFIESKNLKVISDEKKDLYFFLANSDYVIGTNSTVLVQSIPFSKGIVLKTGWHKEFQSLIDSGNLELAKNSEEVIEIIKKLKLIKKINLSNKIFKPNFTKNFKAALSNII